MTSADLSGVLDEVVAALHDVTCFLLVGAVMTVDPNPLLPTGGVVEGSPDACARF